MLLKKGATGKKRLVKESSVELMTTNHLTAEQQAKGRLILGDKTGWGFGVSVLLEPDALASKPGRYGWNGGLGSSWWNDPERGLIAIILTERVFESADPPAVVKDFWRGAYATAGN